MMTRNRARAIAKLLPLLLLAAPAVEAQVVIFVDDDAPPGGDGATWPTAYRYLQDALAEAAVSGVPTAIRVARGRYTPDRDESGNVTPGDRAASFHLVNGLVLEGGYAGLGTRDPDLRDVRANLTVLSGDLDGDDGPSFANYDENSDHVLKGRYIDETTVVEGFTITGGNATLGNAGQGGGLLNEFASSPTLVDCSFLRNSARNSGGAVYSYASSPALVNCSFIGNRTTGLTTGLGGAARFVRSDATLTNCSFVGNSGRQGGAVQVYLDSHVRLANCTFAGNVAAKGRALACVAFPQPSLIELSNCILWDGSGEVWDSGCSIVMGYSDVLGGWAGEGNIESDPLFRDVHGPDNVLGTEDDDVRPGRSSPCIDAGDNTAIAADTTDLDGDGDTAERVPVDLGGEPRFVDDPLTVDTGVPDPPDYLETVDIGAYEYQVAAPDEDEDEDGDDEDEGDDEGDDPPQMGQETACCTSSGCLEAVSPTICSQNGGIPFGLCTTCDQVSCPNPVCIGAEGSCFEAHPTPGCDSLVCCDQICGNDPFCCEVEWDQQCARTQCAATGDEATCCNPEGTCVSGVSSSGCVGSGGETVLECLGDADGDGVDEACVCNAGDGGIQCGRVTCPPGETCCCAPTGSCSSGQACPDVECP